MIRSIVTLMLALELAGCASVHPAPQPPRPPDGRQSERTRPVERAPVLVAPPPAYGNKIVLASGGGGTSL